MANSTFSGPVRSQNGFQEWDGTAWVPVAGGGGGNTLVYLNNASAAFYGADNRYSTDGEQNPPTGATAGTFVQLPEIPVGSSYEIINPTGGSSFDCWALKLPTIAGIDIAAFSNNAFQAALLGGTGSFPVYTGLTTYLGNSSLSAPSDTLFIYGALDQTSALLITRLLDVSVPGFGNVALFKQATPAVFAAFNPFPDQYVYPYTQRISP